MNGQGGAWSQRGSDIDGEAADDASGGSVSLSSDGSRVAIGAYNNDGNGSQSGHVRIFEWVAGAWIQKGLDIDGQAFKDQSGRSVSLSSDGSRVAIGAPAANYGDWIPGYVKVYEWLGGVWTQLGQNIDGEAIGDRNGFSVSLSSDGTRISIGADKNSGNYGYRSGHVRVFDLISGIWTQLGLDIDGEAEGDQSGHAISMSSDGSRLAIGAQRNHGNGLNSGHVRVYNLSLGNNCSYPIDSIVAENANKGVYRAYFDTLVGEKYQLQFRTVGSQNWKTKVIRDSSQLYQRFNITPNYNVEAEVRLRIQDSTGTWIEGCESTFDVPCRNMFLQMVEQQAAFCEGDSSLLKVGISGGQGVKTFLWSNGGTNKRTYAQQGETLSVTVTDAAGCSLTDSITSSIVSDPSTPSNFSINKISPTEFQGSWTPAALPTGSTIIGHRIAYRLKGTLSWINSALTTNNFVSVDFTNSGNLTGNYEFVAFTRYNDGSSALNSGFTCIEVKGYSGSGNKNEGTQLNSSLNQSGIAIYPNPTQSILYVSAKAGSRVQLTDVQGRILHEQVISDEEAIFNLANYAQGVYLIKVTQENQLYIERVIKD